MRHISNDIEVFADTGKDRIEKTRNFVFANFFIVDGTHRVIHACHCCIKNNCVFTPVAKTLGCADFNIFYSLKPQLKLCVKSWAGERQYDSYIQCTSIGFHERMFHAFDNLFSVELIIRQYFFLAGILFTSGSDFACVNKINFTFCLRRNMDSYLFIK